ATGGSAGAGISLWLAFHADLAQPDSKAVVARQSTRLTCAGLFGAQSSYDPPVTKKIIGGRAHEHGALLPFCGLSAGELGKAKAQDVVQREMVSFFLRHFGIKPRERAEGALQRE